MGRSGVRQSFDTEGEIESKRNTKWGTSLKKINFQMSSPFLERDTHTPTDTSMHRLAHTQTPNIFTDRYHGKTLCGRCSFQSNYTHHFGFLFFIFFGRKRSGIILSLKEIRSRKIFDERDITSKLLLF